jgi:hypothetical protein
VLAECGANIGARDDDGLTPLQLSTQRGHHQVAQLLTQLERKAAATSERAQQAAEQDITEAAEAAERMAAHQIEEEEREECRRRAQTKVRAAPPSPRIGLLCVQLNGERCGVSVSRVGACPLTA